MTWNVVVQSGHLINVLEVKFAPDGRSLATCSADESIRLWDIGLGCESGVLAGHRGPVYHIVFSANGKLLASGGWDQEVRIWDVDFRRTLKVLRGIKLNRVDVLAFSNDGSIAAATGNAMSKRGRQLLVWDAESGSVLFSEQFPQHSRIDINLTADGRHLAFFDTAGICVLHVPTGERRILVSNADAQVPRFAFTRDGRTLLVWSEGLQGFDVKTGELHSEERVNELSRSLTMLPDGQEAGHATVGRYSIRHGADAVSPNGDLLARIAGREVELVDPDSGETVRRLGGRLRIEIQPGNVGRQFVLAASPVEPVLAAGGPDGLVRLWDLARTVGPMTIRADHGYITAVAFSPDGMMIATGGFSGIRVWRRDGGSAVLEVPAGAAELAFSGDGSAIAATVNREVRAFAVPSGREIVSISLKEMTTALAVSPYNEVAVGTKERLLWWDSFLTGEPRSGDVEQIRDISFALDGRLAVATGLYKWAMLGRALPGRGAVYAPGAPSLTVLDGHSAAMRAIAFSPDGLSVATGGEDGALMVWDPGSGERRFAVEGAHIGDVTSVAFLHDSRVVATIGYDGAIRLWGSDDGALTATLLSLDENDYVAFTADGRYAATKGGLGAIFLRTDDGLYPFEQFDLQLNRPDVLLRRIGYAPPAIVEAYADASNRRLVRLGASGSDDVRTSALPELRLTANPPPVAKNGSTVIGVELTPAARPLTQLHLAINDVPVYGRAGLRLDGDQTSVDLHLELTPGDNEVQLWAVDEGGAQSMRRSFRVFDNRPEQPRRLFVVGVGISAYHDERYRLQYAAKDARDLVAELRIRGTRFAAIEALLLQDARRDAILNARTFLGETSTIDHVVVLLAGHGVLLGTDFAFLPADAIADDLAGTAISYEHIEGLIDGIPARRRLMLLDTCHSGEDEGLGAVTDGRPLPTDVTRGRSFAPMDPPPEWTAGRRDLLPGRTSRSPVTPDRSWPLVSLRDTFADLRQESGAFVIAAAGATDYALERADLRNGVFTASVLEAMRHNETLTVTQLAAEVSASVLALTGGRQQPMVRRENLADDYRVI